MTRDDLKDYRNNKDYINEKMEELMERRRRIEQVIKYFIRYAKTEVEK